MDLRTQLLDHAITQYFQLGIRSVSMDDISAQMGISKKTIYQHFASKSELVHSAMERYVLRQEEEIREVIEQSEHAVDEMIQLSRLHVAHMREIKPTLIYDLQKYYAETYATISDLHMQFFKVIMESNLRRGQAEGSYREDLDPDVVAKLYVSKSFSLVDEGLFSLKEYEREHLLQQHIIYHIYGILSRQGRDQFDASQLFNN